ncbi:MAG: hypothetical protein JO234_13620 [Hyphomicrobiales bacterium]|nr:hypothetical protein [Hyphomicrobiales bacterium]
MKRFPIAIGSAAFLLAGAAAGSGFASEVNDISWNLETNYNGGNQTVCIAENYHNYPVTAVFNVYPAAYDPDGNPAPTTAVVTLPPYTESRVFSWAAGYSGPGPNCSLLNYSVAVTTPGGVQPE